MLFDEFKGGTERFKDRVAELQALLREYSVDGFRPLVRAFRKTDEFRKQWSAIWQAAARDDGGKLSRVTAGAILGAVLGGVGIAAMGGAIGLPLLAVLGLGGLLAGSEVDAAVRRKWGQTVTVELPRKLHERLASKAHALGVEPRMLLADIVDVAVIDGV